MNGQALGEKGRPGWHSGAAMIHRYLGTPIDIHGVGSDLVFPHRERERAGILPGSPVLDAHRNASALTVRRCPSRWATSPQGSFGQVSTADAMDFDASDAYRAMISRLGAGNRWHARRMNLRCKSPLGFQTVFCSARTFRR